MQWHLNNGTDIDIKHHHHQNINVKWYLYVFPLFTATNTFIYHVIQQNYMHSPKKLSDLHIICSLLVQISVSKRIVDWIFSTLIFISLLFRSIHDKNALTSKWLLCHCLRLHTFIMHVKMAKEPNIIKFLTTWRLWRAAGQTKENKKICWEV